jgi:glycosyltransferase involved in cell wall biosynthesis
MKRIIIIGPAYPLRGGLATFNQRLAEEFIKEGHDCKLVSFSLQYPSLLFPGKTQYNDGPAPKGLTIQSIINSINPLNWIKIGKQLAKERPDLIVVRFWIPFMGPGLGTILRQVKKNNHTTVICIADNVIPHEHRIGDRNFTSYFLKVCDGFVTMSEKVLKDLRLFEEQKPAQFIQHPLYDNFGHKISKEEARNFLKLDHNDKVIVFFGFVRKYKGLDLLLLAMNDNRIKSSGIKLLVAGEFYEDEKLYQQIIRENQLQDQIILKNNFIADDEVKYYLCAADMVIQPYRNATQSGVTPLAYHFEKPMVVTNVGGLPDLVPDHKVGLVCEPQPQAIASAILEFYQLGEDYFIPHLRNEKQKYAWKNLTKAIFNLEETISTN